MVNVGKLVDQTSRLANMVILTFFILENLKYFWGVDVIKAIREAPPFDYKAIVAQYPWLFFGLSTALAVLVMVDQTVLSRFYRGVLMPPIHYAAAISITMLALSITLMIFLRDTPLFWFYLYFSAVPVLALVHIMLIRVGIFQEIKEPWVEEGPPVRVEELVKSQTIYPLYYQHSIRSRRVVR